jgi:NAD(P)-dependent dehydrogenase (short-subunit alcohol dehydrogenase family)
MCGRSRHCRSKRGNNKVAVAELSKIGPPISALILDVTDQAQCCAAVQEVVRRHGRLGILVNNAGMGAAGGAALPDDMPLASWQKVIDTNFMSAFVLSQLA